MKYVCCRYMYEGLRFYLNTVHVCCSIKPGPILAENFDPENIHWEDIHKKRLEALENFRNGIIPENCRGCVHLKEDNWDDLYGGSNSGILIKEIFLLHWLHCNCSCVYCVNQNDTKGMVTRKPKDSDYYNAYPILKEAVKKGYISKDLTLHCLGGESAVLKEMDKILKLFIKNGLRYVYLVTSGIGYIKPMHEIFKKYDGEIVISLDSGCRETYRKIKRVDKYEQVISNIKKYIKDARGNMRRIMLKYILTEGYNDSREEIDKFFEVLKELGMVQTRIDIDYSKTCAGETCPIPKHFHELNGYFREKAARLNLTLKQYAVMDKIFNEGHY